MKFVTKSIALTTLLAVSSGIGFLGAASQVSATMFQGQQANPSKISQIISSKPSIVGSWKGQIIPKGDDTATFIEIDVLSQAGNTKQGTWKFWGYDTKTQKDIVIQNGTLTATVNNNDVILELKEKGKTMIKFKTQVKNNKLTGESFEGKSQTKYLINLKKG
ncbi:hypothetical protein DSM106972_058500 [Dulcicalothrix desertica PCC 7102]|uniref:Lipocalin-like domain-containing protein n=1 Tax=Dulcicalothrix desertica PCC 7102 TaxID=232991 RepID=A0A3S1ITX7_9CYAN|nr:hypothetical protein [Dulcicalothrix desertica]RUT02372.1 hypothetical protein DSM106972_058500 [Dulcicalothrix desertica PCC 7102]TWH55405.1 hypothetical protein CAL7102_03539 [Dulcicalothrix desertica PCC 7102]